jgi:hypothetical protein
MKNIIRSSHLIFFLIFFLFNYQYVHLNVKNGLNV